MEGSEGRQAGMDDGISRAEMGESIRDQKYKMAAGGQNFMRAGWDNGSRKAGLDDDRRMAVLDNGSRGA